MCTICNSWLGSDSDLTSSSQPYVTLPAQWPNRPGRTITWSNATLFLHNDPERNEYISNNLGTGAWLQLTRQAFAVWQAMANVTFREVSDNAASNIRIGFGEIDGSYGTGGSTLAHHIGWYRESVRQESVIAMDVAESWNTVDFFNVMVHEIGHALGLDHSAEPDAVMYASYDWSGTNQRSRLHADDIAGVRHLFGGGSPLPTWAPPGSFVNFGNQTTRQAFYWRRDNVHSVTNENDYFRFSLNSTRGVYIQVSGLNADADLRLYDQHGRLLVSQIRPSTNSEHVFRQLGPGTYYIRVNAFSQSRTINYWLGFLTSDMADLGDLSTRNGTDTNSVNKSFDDTDGYRFSLSGRRSMRFELTGLSADADLRLYGTDGSFIAASIRGGTANDVIQRTLDAGTYYLRVNAYTPGRNISYRLNYGWAAPPALNFGDETARNVFRWHRGSVHSVTDPDDYFRFTLTQNRLVHIWLTDLNADADLFLYDGNGQPVAASRRGSTSPDQIFRELSTGTYYIRVDAFARNQTINYWLGLITADVINLGNVTGRSGTRFGSVNSTNDSIDGYRFNLTSRTSMRFELTGLSADADLRLFDSNGNFVDLSNRAGRSNDVIERSLAAGTYYLRVNAFATGQTISYRLNYGSGWSPPSPALNFGDETARNVYRWHRGSVHSVTDDEDYFRFTLTQERIVHIQLTGLNADADLFLYDDAGQRIASSSLWSTGRDQIFRELNAGTYYINVEAFTSNETINYWLGLVTSELRDFGNVTVSSGTQFDTVNSTNDLMDGYRFSLDRRRNMRFSLTELSADADLRLYRSNGSFVDLSNNSGRIDDVIDRTLDAGTYYLRVDAFTPNQTISYRLNFGAGQSLQSNSRVQGMTTGSGAAPQDLWNDSAMTVASTLRPDEHNRQWQSGTLLA